MTEDKNPRAFPCGEGVYEPGMTLRDWLAGQVLAEVYHRTANPTGQAAAIAKETYAIADALIAERSK